MRDTSKAKATSVSLPSDFLEQMETHWRSRRQYSSRSSFIEEACRDRIQKDLIHEAIQTKLVPGGEN